VGLELDIERKEVRNVPKNMCVITDSGVLNEHAAELRKGKAASSRRTPGQTSRGRNSGAPLRKTKNWQVLHVVGGELREGIWRGLFEAGEAAAKDEADFVGGAVALLGDLDFGLVAFFGRGFHF